MSELIQDTSRRNILRGGGAVAAIGLGSVLLSACSSEKAPAAATSAAAAAAGGPQSGKKVIFVVHDKNPFFAPVQKGFENFAASMGWEAQFTGPPAFDVQATVDLQTNALNAKPAGLILTRADDQAFDANIKKAKEAGIPVVLSNVAGAGYKDLNVGFVGQDFVAAGQVAGREIAKYAEMRSGQQNGSHRCGQLLAGQQRP